MKPHSIKVRGFAALVAAGVGWGLPAAADEGADWQARLGELVEEAGKRPGGEEAGQAVEALEGHVLRLAELDAETRSAWVGPVHRELMLAADSGVVPALLYLGDDLVGTDPAAAVEAYRDAAQRYDLVEDWARAIDANLSILAAMPKGPEAEAARRSIEVQVELLRAKPAPLDPAVMAALEPVWERALRHKLYVVSMLHGERLREQGRSEEAFAVFQTAAKRGYAPAMIQVGLMYSNGDGVAQDMEKASSWLRPANVKGDPLGKYLLAECFLYGKGIPENRELGVSLLNQAVVMDHPGRAYDLLASCYHKGWGVEVDYAQAAEYYREACRDGFANAYANLAVMYMRGQGVERNPTQAVKLLLNGVEEENPLCMFFYGAAHLDGLGVETNEVVGRQWMVRAARAGSPQAQAWCEAEGVSVAEGE